MAWLAVSCVGAEGEPGAAPETGRTERIPVAEPIAQPAAEPATEPNAEPARQAALPPATKPAPPTVPPEKLIGMAPQAINKLLGRPQFRRADARAELWRYRAGRCILDLFLYPPRDAPGGPLAVSHVEARLADGAPAATPRCLDAVLKARASAGTT